jgi:hypothetical protein
MEPHAYQPAATDTFPTIPSSYLEDNYTTCIFKNVNNTPGNDLVISAHPNGIAFITLAISHAAFKISAIHSQQRAINAKEDDTLVDACLTFDVGYQQPGEASGKSLLQAKYVKGRGPLISPDQPICILQLSGTPVSEVIDGKETIPHISSETIPRVGSSTHSGKFSITLPGVKGRLVEINQKITTLKGIDLVNVLRDEYIALVELRPSELDTLRAAAASGVGEK